MAATPPSSVDLEMVDALSPASTLSPPPDSGSEYEDVKTKKDSPNPQITSLEKINLESPLTGTDLANMARRSARNTNKPRPVVVSPARPAKRKIVTKVSAAKKAPKWTAEKLLKDTKSPLASADLRVWHPPFQIHSPRPSFGSVSADIARNIGHPLPASSMGHPHPRRARRDHRPVPCRHAHPGRGHRERAPRPGRPAQRQQLPARLRDVHGQHRAGEARPRVAGAGLGCARAP